MENIYKHTEFSKGPLEREFFLAALKGGGIDERGRYILPYAFILTEQNVFQPSLSKIPQRN